MKTEAEIIAQRIILTAKIKGTIEGQLDANHVILQLSGLSDEEIQLRTQIMNSLSGVLMWVKELDELNNLEKRL